MSLHQHIKIKNEEILQNFIRDDSKDTVALIELTVLGKSRLNMLKKQFTKKSG